MKCFKCGKRKCNTKIRCEAPIFNFAACDEHINDLEKKADADLGSYNGVMRTHLTCSGGVKKND